ncbi:hypothetical protein [Psychrosphaera algicola]
MQNIATVEEIVSLGIDPTKRAENLSLDDYIKIAQWLDNKKQG